MYREPDRRQRLLGAQKSHSVGRIGRLKAVNANGVVAYASFVTASSPDNHLDRRMEWRDASAGSKR